MTTKRTLFLHLYFLLGFSILGFTKDDTYSDSLYLIPIDSILQVSEIERGTFNKLDSLLAEYADSLSPESYRTYLETGLELAEKANYDTLALQYVIGLYPYNELLVDYERNETIALKHIEIARRIGNLEEIILGHNELGLSRRNQNKFDAAIDAYLQGIEYANDFPEPLHLQALQRNIASCYKNLGEIEEAVGFLKKLIELRTQQEQTPYKTYFALNDYKSLIDCYLIQKDTSSIGLILPDLLSLIGSLDKLEMSGELEENINYNLQLVLSRICRYYLQTGAYRKAKEYHAKIGAMPVVLQEEKHEIDFHYYLATKNFQKAGEVYQSYTSQFGEPLSVGFISDAILYFQEAKDYEKVTELYRKKYESELDILKQNKASLTELTNLKLANKDKENELLQATVQQSKLQSKMFLFFSFAGLFLITTLVLTYRSRQIKRHNQLIRRNLENNQLILQQAERITEITLNRNKFLINIAHEFQTPLSVIIGLADQIRKTFPLSEKTLEKNTETILNSAKGVSDHLTKILQNSVVQGHTSEPEIEIFDIVDRVRKIVEEFSFFVRQKGVRINLKTSYSALDIHSDPTKIEIVVKNLLSNAIKHASGGSVVNIHLADTGAETVEILICDKGPGIPQEIQKYIFERFFYHSQDDEPEQGYGIGLSMCKEYVENLGGEISFSTADNQGTVFKVLLPINNHQVVKPNTSDLVLTGSNYPNRENFEENSFSEKARENKKPGILIVENNLDFQYFLQSTLKEHYDLIFANNGVEAKSFINAEAFDLVLTDWMMPDADGEELIEYIKNEVNSSVQILVLSAKPLISHKLKMLHSGADIYLTKPITGELLLDEIEILLNRKRLLPEDKIIYPTDLSKISENDKIFLFEFEKVILGSLNDFSLNVEYVASALNVSTSQLKRRVKNITGFGTKSYIQEMRFWEARRLFEEESPTSVKEVCFSVGFKDTKNFARNFKKRFGKYPSEYL